PSSIQHPISAVASRDFDPSKNRATSSPSSTTRDTSVRTAQSSGRVQASSATVGWFRYFRRLSSGRAAGDQIRSMIGRTSGGAPSRGFFHSQSEYTNSNAALSDSGSDMSVSGGAIRASYKIRV